MYQSNSAYNQKMHIECCLTAKQDEWNRFLQKHPRKPFFYSLQWLEMLARHHDATLELCLFRDIHGDIKGIFPIFHRNYFLLQVYSSPYVVTDTPYLGPLLCDDFLGDAAWDAIAAFARDQKMDFLRFFTNVDTRLSEKIFQQAHVVRKTTHILDLTRGLDAVWDAMEGSCRTHVRKAQRAKVTVTSGQPADQQFIETYIDALSKVFSRQGLALPNERSFYREMWRTFGGREIVGLQATREGCYLGGALILMDEKDAYYISGASAADGVRYSCNNLLQWEAIGIAVSRGIERYDFVGSDIPRIARFKKSFGGSLREYWCVELSLSPLAQLTRNLYPRFKRWLGRL